jgi:hypothetical protein
MMYSSCRDKTGHDTLPLLPSCIAFFHPSHPHPLPYTKTRESRNKGSQVKMTIFKTHIAEVKLKGEKRSIINKEDIFKYNRGVVEITNR